ncbi:hypothetical protein [Nitrosophilus labii]|uniref:hypothetical protein n=1 Tax=Nitrosophilus labii TaxID=2706014 RepID=UPI001657033E|nr:hypothetical protein [Nitrosophilus labii]
MSDKKFGLDVLKVLLDGIKTKLLLFSAGFGGSIAILLKSTNTISILFFSFSTAILFLGLIVNLLNFNKILNEVKRIKNEW